MLDAFIIEELRRREEREKAQSERPRLELPLYNDQERRSPADKARDKNQDKEPERGVVVIDLHGDTSAE